jgi:hypothetical protein
MSLNKRGPLPVFTDRLVVNVRPDQVRSLDHIAAVVGCSRSDVVRWMLDTGVTAVESYPTFKTLPRRDAV